MMRIGEGINDDKENSRDLFSQSKCRSLNIAVFFWLPSFRVINICILLFESKGNI
jgi:hypothetical protein